MKSGREGESERHLAIRVKEQGVHAKDFRVGGKCPNVCLKKVAERRGAQSARWERCP